jgi:DNA-binding SARP family transcriptional activator
MLAFDLLGPPVLRRDGTALPLTVKKAQALLVLLACNGAMPRSRVVALLWPQLDESTGRRNLRRELARLREAGAADALAADADLLAPAAGLQIDARRFETACDAGRHDEALALWRGPPADGLDLEDAPDFGDWLARQREGLQRTRQQALAAAARAHESRGDADRALQCIQTLLAEDPLQERHHRDAMRLLAACGRREAALAQYARCCELLCTELGLTPMGETEELAAALRGAPATPAPSVDPPRALLPGVLPFVGRSAEVAILEAAWRAGAAVLIEGEGGIGKTRLARDFLAAHGPYALARCLPGDAELPYAAFTRALRAMAGPDLMLEGLPRWAVDELARLLPELGPLPQPIRSPEERGRFFEACALAWCALAEESFDAVVLDDWHLADGASQALLRFVARRRREQGAGGAREWLLLRPEFDAESMRHLADSLQVQPLRLQALDDAAVLELVRQLSGAARPALFASRLHAATAGNPFFLSETLHHLADQRWLDAGEDGIWRTPFDAATQDYRELPVPASVRDAVLARVQRLGAAGVRVLEAAALAGEPFAPAMLAPACALSELQTVLAIEQAVQARLLREHESGGYAFAHDQIQQALQGALPPDRRRLVHRRLALAALSTRHAPALIAQHFEAGGEPARAAPLRLAAGDEAQRLFDGALALQHWQLALAAAPDATLRARLLPRCAHALVDIGDAEAAHARLAELDLLLRSAVLPAPAQAEAVIACAELETALDRNADALPRIEALLAQAPGGALQSRALRVRGQALQNLGRLDDARACAEAALQQTGSDATERAALLDMLTMIEYLRGRPKQALALAREVLVLWEVLGDRRSVVKGHFRVGTLLLVGGDAEGGRLMLERARMLAAELHLIEQQRDIIVNLMKVHADRGDGAGMLALAEEGWNLAPGFPRPRTRQLLLQARFHARLLLGELGTALTLAEQVLAEAEASGEPGALQYAVLTLLDLLIYLGDFERGRALLHRLTRSGAQELAYLGVKLLLQRAFLESRAGQPAAARAALVLIGEPQTLQQPQDRADLALREADVLLAEGQPAAALDRLQAWLHSVPSVPVQAMIWALHLRAALTLGPVPNEDWHSARAVLARGAVPPLEALDLQRALSRSAPDAALGAELAATAAATAERLAASLQAWPEHQRRWRAELR